MQVNFGLLLVFFLAITFSAFSQEVSFGDEKTKDEVKKKTAAIYDDKDKTHFFLTEDSFGEKSTCGTEITAYSKGNLINRIVSKTCNTQGRMATEFYFENEKTIFVYRVFEFFDGKAENDAWKNFKGLASWEGRYYFVNDNLKFHSHKGRNDFSEKETGERQIDEASKILKFLKGWAFGNPNLKSDLPNPHQIIHPYLTQNNYLTPLLELKSKEKEYLSSPMKSFYLERMTLLESYVSNFKNAYQYEDIFLSGLPQSKTSREKNSKELSESPLKEYKALDAIDAIADVAAKEQVIMINEEHRTPFHRAFTLQILSDLYKKGFRYFAAETVSISDQNLNQRGYPTQETGFYTDDPVYADLIRTALKLGYKVIPYEYEEKCERREDDPFFCQEAREKGQAQNLYDRILKNDPKAKILVHAGRGHNAKSSFKEFSFMAWHFKDTSKIDPFTIDQLEFSERFNPNDEEPLYRYLIKQNLIQKPIVFKNSNNEYFSQSSGYDMQIFHPRMEYENGRATFLKLNGLRKPIRINFKKLKLNVRDQVFTGKESVLIQAFYENENTDAIPIDQIILYQNQKVPVLMLKKGGFRIRAMNETGKILDEYNTKLRE